MPGAVASPLVGPPDGATSVVRVGRVANWASPF